MKIRNLIFKENVEEETREVTGTVTNVSYSELLNLGRPYSFYLLRKNVENENQWHDVKVGAVDLLRKDLQRLGETLYIIDAGLRNKLMGSIGAMVLFKDNNGNVMLRFHKRDEDGIWDNTSKTYPEKFLTDTQKAQIKDTYEIFFALEDDE